MGLEGLGIEGVVRRRKGGGGKLRKGEKSFILYIVATNCRRSDITMLGCKWKLLKLKQRKVQYHGQLPGSPVSNYTFNSQRQLSKAPDLAGSDSLTSKGSLDNSTPG